MKTIIYYDACSWLSIRKSYLRQIAVAPISDVNGVAIVSGFIDNLDRCCCLCCCCCCGCCDSVVDVVVVVIVIAVVVVVV